MVIPRLSHNIIALMAVQVGNLMVPLVTLPYLARVLGIEVYGLMVWVQAVMLFGVILVDFGFGWSATRDISANRQNKGLVAQIFANTWAVQWALALLFAVCCMSLVYILEGPVTQPELYAAGLGIVFGQVLLPIWIFQGLETLRELAVIQLIGKFIALPLVFIFVNEPDDMIWALVFISFPSMVAGCASLLWLHSQRLVGWVRPDTAGMWLALRGGALLFTSRALISLYTTLVPLAVGYWSGTTQLAYFNLADKLRTVVQAMLNPVSQALFPRMSWLFQHNSAEAFVILRKFAVALMAISGFAGIILFVGAESLMVLLGGADFANGAEVLRWLAAVPAIVALSNLMGVQIMLPRGMNAAFTSILALASLISVVFLYSMTNEQGAVGAAQLVLGVEGFVTAAMAMYLWRFGAKSSSQYN
jgi:PST family polysaccharide transporter